MNYSPYRHLLGACAVSLVTGCATTVDRVALDAGNTLIEPVYRVQQPAGTAAGQYAVGRLDLAEGRIDAAIRRFRAALKLDPVFVEAHNGLGVVYGHQGRFAEATDAFRRALASGPASAHVLSNLGYAQMRVGDLHEAWESFVRAVELDPKNRRTLENVRALVSLQRRKAAAVAHAAAPSTGERAAASAAAASDAVAANGVVVSAIPVRLAGPEQGATEEAADRRSAGSDSAISVVLARAQSLAASFVAATKPQDYEVVPVNPNQAKLVQVAPNVFDLRAGTDSREEERATARAAVDAPVPPSRSGAAAPVQLALGAVTHFEVSNGAGIDHLAGRTAQRLGRLGAKVRHVTNYETFDRKRTEIHYLGGFAEQAKLVQSGLPVDARLVAVERLRPGVNVRLVVGRDIATGHLAWWRKNLDLARDGGSAGARGDG